jgi:hypothetical protein
VCGKDDQSAGHAARLAWWDDVKKVVLIFDPKSIDKGTAFIPGKLKAYFDALK